MHKKGFTLIELIVTIALLGLIGSIIAINIVGLSKKQEEKETSRIESTIKAAADVYVHEEDIGTGCLPIKDLISNNYLKESNIGKYKNKFIIVSKQDNSYNYEIVDSCNDTPESSLNSYKVTYKENLDGEDVSNMPKDNKKYKYNEEVILSKEIPSTKGYIFRYWSTSKSGTEVKLPLKMKKHGITLYAIWAKKDFTITFKANGGTPAPGPITGKYKSNVTIQATNPTKKGYTFTHWQDASNNTTYTKGNSITLINNITLNAIYNANIYTISLNHQNGSSSINKIYEKYDNGFYYDSTIASPATQNLSKITSVSIPTRTGYEFQGYYTQTNGQGTKYIDKTGKILASNNAFSQNTTLYAYYTKKEYTITINVNNGTKNEPILSKIKYQESGEQKITPKTGYGLDASKGGKVSCSGSATYSYDNNKNTLKISNVTSNVSCSINYVKTYYNVTLKVKNGSIADLYNQVLNNSTIYEKYISRTKSEPYIKYEFEQEKITPKQLFTEQNIEDGEYVSIGQMPGKCNGHYGDLTICKDGKIDWLVYTFCQIKREGNELVKSPYENSACNHGYIFDKSKLIAYHLILSSTSNSKRVRSIYKYTVKDVKSTESGLYKDTPYTSYMGTSKNIYFYRGEIDNNYVSFAGKNWRILRLNEDKTIRLILEGNIGKSQYLDKNITCGTGSDGYFQDCLKHYGFTYDNKISCTETNPCITEYKNNTFTNNYGGTNNIIKNKLENWYQNNLNSFDKYIALSEFINTNEYDNRGYHYINEEWRWYIRDCIATDKNKKENKYPGCPSLGAVNGIKYGGVYKTKIGIMSAYEIMDSGFINGYLSGSYQTNPLTNHFLNQNYDWWTMTPSFHKIWCQKANDTWNCHGNELYMATANKNVGISESNGWDNYYVRPVISLKEGIQATGKGTKSDPYNIITSGINNVFTATGTTETTYEYPIIPNYEMEYSKITCTNNQTKNAKYNKATNKFSIKPNDNTECTIEFEKPLSYKIALVYPTSTYDEPTITFNENYTLEKRDFNGYRLNLRFFYPKDFKLNIKINKYRIATTSEESTSSLSNLSSNCPGYKIENNIIKFNGFDASQDNKNCTITIKANN